MRQRLVAARVARPLATAGAPRSSNATCTGWSSDARRSREQAAEARAAHASPAGSPENGCEAWRWRTWTSGSCARPAGRTGARSAGLASRHRTGGAWSATAVRGDLPGALARLRAAGGGDLPGVAGSVASSARREELERLPGMPAEIAQLAMFGVSLLAPLVTARGEVEALVACEDRPDGGPIGEIPRARLEARCARRPPWPRATARRFRDQRDRALELLAEAHEPGTRRHEAAFEASERLPAGGTRAVPGERECAPGPGARARRLGVDRAGRAALDSLAISDPSSRLVRLRRVVARRRSLRTRRPRGERGRAGVAGGGRAALRVAAARRAQHVRELAHDRRLAPAWRRGRSCASTSPKHSRPRAEFSRRRRTHERRGAHAPRRSRDRAARCRLAAAAPGARDPSRLLAGSRLDAAEVHLGHDLRSVGHRVHRATP